MCTVENLQIILQTKQTINGSRKMFKKKHVGARKWNMKHGTWNTVAWNGFIQNFWIIVDNGKHELVVNLRRICQGLPAESQLDRWRPEGDDMKSGILSILWKSMGLKVDHAEAVLRSQQDEVVEMVYNYFFNTVESW